MPLKWRSISNFSFIILIARKKAFDHLSSDYFMKSITGLLTVILIAVGITGAAQEEVTIV